MRDESVSSESEQSHNSVGRAPDTADPEAIKSANSTTEPPISVEEGTAVTQSDTNGSTSESRQENDEPLTEAVLTTPEKMVDMDRIREEGHRYEAGSSSDYQSYDLETLIQLAEAGDREAQLLASLHKKLPLEQRREYVVAAAKQGYTSALMRFGVSQMMSASPLSGSKMSADEATQSRINGFAYIYASRELGDYASEDAEFFNSFRSQIQEEDFEEAIALAEQIVDEIENP